MSKEALSLQEQNVHEVEWFKENFAGADLSIRSRLGITALVEKVDWMFHQYLNKTYVPERMVKLEREEVECVEQLRQLGIAPNELPILELRGYVKERLQLALCPDVAEDICDDLMRDLPSVEIAGCTRYERVLAKQKLIEQYMLSLQNEAPVHGVAERVADVVCQCFDGDDQGDYRLCRFSTLRKTFEEALKDYVCMQAQGFRDTAFNMLQTNIQMSQGGDLDVEKLRSGVADVAMFTLLVPVTAMEFFDELWHVVNATPEEDCGRQRADLQDKLTHVQESIAALRVIQNF